MEQFNSAKKNSAKTASQPQSSNMLDMAAMHFHELMLLQISEKRRARSISLLNKLAQFELAFSATLSAYLRSVSDAELSMLVLKKIQSYHQLTRGADVSRADSSYASLKELWSEYSAEERAAFSELLSQQFCESFEKELPRAA